MVNMPCGAQTSAGVAMRASSTHVSPGDRIELHFFRDRELSGGVTVSERGEPAFAKLGVLRVDSMTIAQLKDTLLARYSVYLRSPEFEISVLRRVDMNSTVRDVIARAGGVTENGNRNKVMIVREGQRLDARGWDREDAPLLDLQSGDQVVVGRKNWFVINALPAISTAVLLGSFVYTVRRD